MHGPLDHSVTLPVWTSLAWLPFALLARPDGVQHLIALLELSPHKLAPFSITLSIL